MYVVIKNRSQDEIVYLYVFLTDIYLRYLWLRPLTHSIVNNFDTLSDGEIILYLLKN